MSTSRLPKLRPLDIKPTVHQGRPSLFLRDPLDLSDRYMILPQALGPALMLCDGEHDAAAIHAALTVRYGLRVDRDVIEQFIQALDESLFLENERSREAMQKALEAYRSAPYRKPALAGNGYPEEPEALRALLNGYLQDVTEIVPLPAHGKAVLSPHIDYQRGGHVYARVWKRAETIAREAELVIVLATDHFGGFNQVTLTRQHYATPYGVLPTEQTLVDQLAARLGPEQVFAGELYHRREHSIELVVTWLHHMRQGKPVELLPILVGSFHPFIENGGNPAEDPLLNTLLGELRPLVEDRRALVVASGDLAHIGPVFGTKPVGIIERADLRALDDALIERLAAGDGPGFWQIIYRERDRTNVCGVAPFYLTLQTVEAAEGERAGYAICPADEHNTSVVSVCGIVLG
ncbi:MAG: AmmeMemoRadiSam system protein B [Caldilineae bacterium]|nr:MAG: AmmeMemoRadiSam system protein B [Caldilineae bacterium]